MGLQIQLPNLLHTGLFHIVVNPIRINQKKPEDITYIGGHNKGFVDINFIPKNYFSNYIKKLLSQSKKNMRVFGGTKSNIFDEQIISKINSDHAMRTIFSMLK